MSNLSGMMHDTMSKIKEMVDVNTIIGTPITTPDGTTLIPVSKVTFGFASGGTDVDGANNASVRFGVGSGAGVTIVPVSFVVIQNGNVRMLYVDPANGNSTLDKAIDMLPGLIDKVKPEKKPSETKSVY